MNVMHLRAMRVVKGVAGIAAILAPAALLFDVRANFYYDWHNHQWLVGYFGEFFRQHGSMPDTLAVTEAVGMPQPVFYGFLLYPILGVMSSMLGAALALRVGVILAFGAVFAGVYLAGRATVRHGGLSFTIAAATTWSTYGLTNLYNRAALPEFFAVALLTAAVGFGVVAITRVRRGGFAPFAWLAGGFAILTAGAHPPTALVSAAFVALLSLTLLVVAVLQSVPLRSCLGATALIGVVGALILAPWIQANAELHAGLGVVGKYRDFSFTPDGCDSWAARFSPLPYDPATGTSPLAGPGTPYIEAPIIFALVMCGGWLLLAGRKEQQTGAAGRADRFAVWLTVVAGAWLVFMLALSLSPAVAKQFRFLAPYVQFGTRFVSHANIGLLVTVLAGGSVMVRRGALERFPRSASAIAAVALLISITGLAIKLKHAAVVKERGDEPQYAWRGERTRLVTPGRPDAAGDYAIGGRLPQLLPATVERATRANFPVGDAGAEFGKASNVKVALERPGWVVTNAVLFPWSEVRVNGRAVDLARLAANQHRVALRLPKGVHALSWSWEPPTIWRVLRWISGGTLIGLLVAMAWGAWLAARDGIAAEKR